MCFRTKYSLLNLPSKLFKYYGYNELYNKGRLAGNVYMALPLDFNDPCDCQRSIINNTRHKVESHNKSWVVRKMKELGYDQAEADELTDSLLTNDINVSKVYRRQFEHLGVLCLTSDPCDTLMWGYYVNNEGYCIEYDTEKSSQKTTEKSSQKTPQKSTQKSATLSHEFDLK